MAAGNVEMTGVFSPESASHALWQSGCITGRQWFVTKEEIMDEFSFIVLERTLELVLETMPAEDDPRIAECVNVIRRFVGPTEETPTAAREEKVRTSVLRLSQFAQQEGNFLVALRLEAIARQMQSAQKFEVA
jgi:hypothetical protein